MSSNEFNLIRIQALQKKIEELEVQLELENENKRRIVTELEVALDHEQSKPKCACKEKKV